MGSPSCSEIPGTAYRSLSPPPSTAVSTSLPAMVVPYLCILLVGLSGMVIAIHPASSNGLRTWFLNLVRSFLPTTAMSSVMGCAANDLRRISTWCRLGADLVPTWSRGSRARILAPPSLHAHALQVIIRKSEFEPEATGLQLNLRFRRPAPPASANHSVNPTSPCLDLTRPEESVRDIRVVGLGRVRAEQLLQGPTLG